MVKSSKVYLSGSECRSAIERYRRYHGSPWIAAASRIATKRDALASVRPMAQRDVSKSAPTPPHHLGMHLGGAISLRIQDKICFNGKPTEFFSPGSSGLFTRLRDASHHQGMSSSAPPAGLEPATCALEVRCSIQLSYKGQSLAVE